MNPEEKPIAENKPMTFEELEDAAKREDWKLVDTHIHAFVSLQYVTWSCTVGILDADFNMRDLAASILDESPEALDRDTQEVLREIMLHEPSPHVQLRIAIALHERGNRDPDVVRLWNFALDDKDVGERARAGCM